MENAICGIKRKANIRWSGDSDFSAAEFPHFFIKRRHSRLIVCIWGLSILDGNYLSLNRIILVSPSVHGYFRSFLVILQWVNMCQYVNMWQYWSSVIAWRWWRRGWDFSTTLEVESSPSSQERWALMEGWMDGWIKEAAKWMILQRIVWLMSCNLQGSNSWLLALSGGETIPSGFQDFSSKLRNALHINHHSPYNCYCR